jgi:hypothetical protein
VESVESLTASDACGHAPLAHAASLRPVCFYVWVRIQIAYNGVIATCPHRGAANSPPSILLGRRRSVALTVLAFNNFIYYSGGAHGPMASPLPCLLPLPTPFASVPFHSSSTITTQNSISLQISSSAQSLDTFRSECCRTRTSSPPHL